MRPLYASWPLPLVSQMKERPLFPIQWKYFWALAAQQKGIRPSDPSLARGHLAPLRSEIPPLCVWGRFYCCRIPMHFCILVSLGWAFVAPHLGLMRVMTADSLWLDLQSSSVKTPNKVSE